MSKAVMWIAVILGIAFLALTAVYLLTPAGSLPSHFPGFVRGSRPTFALSTASGRWSWRWPSSRSPEADRGSQSQQGGAVLPVEAAGP